MRPAYSVTLAGIAQGQRQHLAVQADARQRRAQLVGGGGGEARALLGQAFRAADQHHQAGAGQHRPAARRRSTTDGTGRAAPPARRPAPARCRGPGSTSDAPGGAQDGHAAPRSRRAASPGQQARRGTLARTSSAARPDAVDHEALARRSRPPVITWRTAISAGWPSKRSGLPAEGHHLRRLLGAGPVGVIGRRRGRRSGRCSRAPGERRATVVQRHPGGGILENLDVCRSPPTARG